MLSTVYSASITGVDGYTVTVECDVRLPESKKKEGAFEIVGLPDAAVKEAKERIRAAMENSGASFPSERTVVINMAPADMKKSGTAFDLAMLVGILKSCGTIPKSVSLDNMAFLGELSLSGAVRSV